MTNYELIKSMSLEEIAKKIIGLNITDEYCKSDCDGYCPHELRCCVNWLQEESK